MTENSNNRKANNGEYGQRDARGNNKMRDQESICRGEAEEEENHITGKGGVGVYWGATARTDKKEDGKVTTSGQY